MIKHNLAKELVYNVIIEYASENKPINQNEILKRIAKNVDNKCDRRTVSRALDELKSIYGKEDGDWINKDIHLHYTTYERSNSSYCKNYWLEFCYDDKNKLSDKELMFLMDAVQFSKHIDQAYAEKLIEKIAKLSPNRSNDVFKLYKNVNEKYVTVGKDFFAILGDINTAISKQNMISFNVNKYGINKKMYRVGGKPVKTCPYKIVVSEGYYFLLCGDRGSDFIKSYRLDMISDVVILDEEFPHTEARKNAIMHSNEYIIEHRYMNSGETVNVTLMVDESILGDVIDSFGTKVRIDIVEDSYRLIVRVKSSEKDIIDWALRYGEDAVVIDPEYLRNEIIEKIQRISNCYRDEDSDLRYYERIESAKRFHRLFMTDIDLSGQESYMNLEGIESISLRHNYVKDFSFLDSYPNLKELMISHNEIEDPSVISELKELITLKLGMTGISNLDFLKGLDKLERLSINEYSLENVDALYSLPSLKYLAVNKPVSRLISKSRLKKIYGESFKYIIDDHFRFVPTPTPSLPKEENRIMSEPDFVETQNRLTTCEVTDIVSKKELCSRIYAGTKHHPVKDNMFVLMEGSCEGAERAKLFEDAVHFTGKDYTWYVTYEGAVLKNGAKPEINKVYAIAVFKKNHGKRLCFMARINRPEGGIRDPEGRAATEMIYSAWYSLIMYLLNNKIGWAEVSGELEVSFIRAGKLQDVIDPKVLVENKVFKDIDIDVDDYHYYRLDESGRRRVKKICYGKIV